MGAITKVLNPLSMINPIGMATNLLTQAIKGNTNMLQQLGDTFKGVFDQVKNLLGGGGLPGIHVDINIQAQPLPFSPQGINPSVAQNPLGPLQNWGGTGMGSGIGSTGGTGGTGGAGSGGFDFPGISASNQQMLNGLSKLDSMEQEAMNLCMSDKPSDQMKGQFLMNRFKQMFEAISNALKAQSDVAKAAIGNIR